MDDSDDEELQLMTDVALLEARLKKAGCPFDETMYSHRFLNFEQQPLANKLKLWRFRKQLREKLLADTLSPSAASGETAAAAPTVIKPEIKQETEKEIKSEQTARVHVNVSKSRPIFHSVSKRQAPLRASCGITRPCQDFVDKIVRILSKQRYEP